MLFRFLCVFPVPFHFFIDLLLLCFLKREKEGVFLNEQRGEEGNIWEEMGEGRQ